MNGNSCIEYGSEGRKMEEKGGKREREKERERERIEKRREMREEREREKQGKEQRSLVCLVDESWESRMKQ